MKNQKGVSLVTLVITIIVILILSAVTFVASLKTIEKTSYSKFTTNVSDVSAAFEESAAIVKGKKIMEDKEKYMEQIYNYVAKNGEEEDDFIHYMNVPPYTILIDEGQLGMEIPEMVVESGTGKKIPVKYATTAQGKIFTWPPLDYEDKFYITAEDTVEHKMQTLIKVGDEEFEIKIDSGDGSLLEWPIENGFIDPDDPSVIPSGEGGGNPADHEHIFFSKTQTDEYFCSEATCVLPKQYYYKCISCDAKGSATYTVGAALGHQWGEETVVKEANCSEKGIIQKKCSVCGTFSTTNEPLNSSNHHGVEIEEITKQATCGEDGTKVYRCSSCNAILRTESIVSTNHNMEKSLITKQPTCTETGIRTYKCSGCDKDMKTEEIPALGHTDEVFEITKRATCTEAGIRTYKCLYCDMEMRTEEIPVLGHDYSNVQMTKEATCTEAGIKSQKCIRCSDTITEEIGALGHNYGVFVVTKEATCKDKGIMTQTCSRCNDEITEEIPIDTSRHYGTVEIKETKEATCTEDGITTKVCSLCNAELESQTVSALGHLWTAAQPPRKCNRCGLEEKEVVAIYSEIDGSLSFLATSENYDTSSTYNGKMISDVYTDFIGEQFEYNTSPWYSVRTNIREVSFDTEISPISTAYWFYGQENLTTIKNIGNLNTTQVSRMDNMFDGCKTLQTIDVSNFDVSNTNTLSNMFANCLMLKEVTGLGNWETNQITDMTSMFFKCRELTTLDISNWDTSNVSSFKTMFSDDGAGLMKLTQLDLNSWNTGSVTNMMGMFEGCGKLASLDLSNWNVSNVTDMSYMFADCEDITEINISGWNTSICQNFDAFLNDCANLVNVNVNELEVDSCTNVSQFFDGCLSLKKLDLSSWNMNNVGTSEEMFSACYSLEEVTLGTGFRFVSTNGLLPTPDPAYISGADGKWYDTATGIGYKSENIPSNKAATYIARIPAQGIAIYTASDNTLSFVKDSPGNIGNTYNGKTITALYTGIESNVYTESMVPWYQYRKNIKTVNVVDDIKPVSTAHWFNGFESCQTFDVAKIDTSETTNMSYMFNNAGLNTTTFSISGMNNWNTSLVTDMAYMFYSAGWNATTFNIGDLSNWNTSSVTNMEYMLDGIGWNAATVNIGNLNNWNTSAVTNMEGMFTLAGYNATTFNIGDLSGWNTSAVTNMKFMFCGTGYTTSTFNIGDLSNWNTSAVTITEGMFASAGYNSTTFDVGELNNWDMSSVTDMSHMFRGAGFESSTWNVGDLSNWNTNNVLDMSDMFAYTGNSASTFTFGDLSTKVVVSGDQSYTAWNVANVTNMDNMFKGSNIKELNLGGWNNTKAVSMSDMFSECRYLEKVTLSNGFTFKGTTSYLPVPNSSYIPTADGNWYDIATSEGYAPAKIPSNKAATYVANAELYTYNVVYQSTTGLELESSTLTKISGTTNTVTPREITGYTTPDAQSVVWDSATPKTIIFLYDPIEYSITIDCNGGSGVSSTSYTIETESFVLDQPVREGYTFTGWTGSNGTTPEPFVSVVNGSIGALSFVANWGTNEYTYSIIYESTTGVLIDSTIQTEIFGTTKTITPPNYDGYKTPEAQTISWDSETLKTITFIYEPIEYSVTINCNGGTGVSSFSYTVEMELSELATPTREGYTFTGWTGSNGTTPELIILIGGGSIGAKNYTANWSIDGYTYNVVYKSKSGIDLGSTTVTNKPGTTNTVEAIEITGYNTPASQSVAWDSENPKTITFIYEPIEYKVTLDLNGGIYDSIVDVARVGDYVNYSANGVTSWRVFDIVDGKVLITPANGPVGSVNLGNADGYANAITRVEAACDKYTNSELGITADDIRSMTTEDINKVAGYTVSKTVTRYAYYLNGDSTFSSGTLSYNGKSYTKTKHGHQLQQGWSTPRFYNWDYAANVAVDENGNSYAYPSKGKPVYVTGSFYETYSISSYNHKGNTSIKVGALLTSTDGWLASTSSYAKSEYVNYYIYTANSSEVTRCYTIDSGADYGNRTYGVRPLVALGSNINASRKSSSDPWNLGDIVEIPYTIETETFTLRTPTKEGVIFEGWTGSNGTTPQTSVSISKGSTENKNYIANWPSNEVAQAIYSETDNSLTFIKDVPQTVGSTYNGKVVTAVYTGIEEDIYTPMTLQPWQDYADSIKSVVFEDVISPISTSYWFNGFSQCTNFGDLSKLKTSQVKDMSNMFADCSSITTLDLSSWDITSLKNVRMMFVGCSALTSINLSNFKVRGIISTQYMFYACSSLTSLDLSDWDTSLVTDMSYMFANCSKLQSITGLSNWDTKNVTTMQQMFQKCSKLTYIGDLSTKQVTRTNGSTYTAWNTSKVTDISSMFDNCYVLETINVSNWNTDAVTKMYAVFSGCNALKTLDLSSWNNHSVTNDQDLFYNCYRLEKVSLGNEFEFVSAGAYLPTPSSNYITGADGKWYDEATGIGYAPENVPSNKAATYVAVLSAVPYTYNIVCKSTSGITIGSSTVTKNLGTTNIVNAPIITGYNTPASQNITWDTETKTITFIYNPTSYNITINCNGGSGVSSTSYNIETPTFTIGTPTREGYTFTGWTDANGTTYSSVTITKGSTGARNYTANWSIIEYNVELTLNGGTLATEDSIVSKVKVGDYVNYSANGVTSWRVFDIVDNEVLITPASGSVGSLRLSNVEGYINAVSKIESACDAYTNSTLGITANDVRSMTAEDINNATGYNTPTSSVRYAYYLNGDTTYSSGTLTYNGNNYTKTKHTSSLYNGYTTPRFYTYDYAQNVAIDENGYRYAYPTNGKPVYVTGEYYDYNPSSYSHVKNSSVTVGSLLGSNYGWLASSCVYADSSDATFRVRYAYSDRIYADYLAYSAGNTNNISYGVRPIVSLGTDIKVTRTSETAAWDLSLNNTVVEVVNIPYTIETPTFTLGIPTKTDYTFAGWTGSNGSTPETTVTIAKGSTGDKNYVANWTLATYSVTIDCNGGSGVSDTTYTMETETFTLGTPTREGYTFEGWTGSNGTTPETTVTIAKGSTGDKSYTANWTANTLYLFNNGDACKSVTGGWDGSTFKGDDTSVWHNCNISNKKIVMTGSGYSFGKIGTVNSINFSDYTTIYCKVDSITSENCRFSVGSSYVILEKGINKINISNKYVGYVRFTCTGGRTEISAVWME